MMYIILGISCLMIILGFVALLKQKTYIDSETNYPVEVVIPIFGRIKTNYPSLIFVFLGVALSMYTLDKFHPPPLTNWEIDGTFTTIDNNFQWTKGHLNVFPRNIDTIVKPNGAYTIRLKINEGITFEDVIERIDYSHRNGNIKIFPKKEFSAYSNDKTTIINAKTSHSRSYKPVKLEPFPVPNDFE